MCCEFFFNFKCGEFWMIGLGKEFRFLGIGEFIYYLSGMLKI